MPALARNPYHGRQRRLIIAFDVGTTFSGVSYVLLIPGEPPMIQGVTQFPGQQKVSGDSKIPSVVCYDKNGYVVAVGSEADTDINSELLAVEGLVRAEWFKLHLRPSHLVAEQGLDDKEIPSLPSNKTVIEIFGDLLRYLYQATKQYIQYRQGDEVLRSVGDNISFILTHPNGWEGKQQSEMRQAAIKGALVANESEAMRRISFVTEGEASLHFCLSKIPSAFESREDIGYLVIDCGGGTIDISAYGRSSNSQFREIASPECLFQGAFFVTRRAQTFLTEKLRRSVYGNAEDIDAMTRYFDRTTKHCFKESLKSYFIRFGRREDDPQFDIRSGAVNLLGSQIAEFFNPSIKSIIQVVEDQFAAGSIPIKKAFLVGGFATSDYLFSKLNEYFDGRGIRMLRPDAYLSKAVAEGAISFTLDHLVTSRISRYTYGIKVNPLLDLQKPDHVSRQVTCVLRPSGSPRVPGYFQTILPKNTVVSEETEFRQPVYKELDQTEFNQLSTKSVMIICYRGRNEQVPEWVDMAPDHFSDLCEVTADLFDAKKSVLPEMNLMTGEIYYRMHFDIVLLFGLTELKAQMAWMENVSNTFPSIVVDI
ncbi:hypothetical protein F5887DRAFT_1108607 [Amanita rubescens]|nr:hypothetical protein F5887DRAFT_1108607 [Amanita rubescens]